MAGFDWVIAAIIVISMIVAVFRGFIKEALSLVSWILAIWLGITFCVEMGEFIHQYIRIPTPKFREWAGFAAVFIGTLFIFAFISYLLYKFIVRGPIKGIDRVLGIGFGVVRGIAISVALLMVARALGLENSQWWQSSKHIPKLVPVMDFVEDLLPNSLQRDELGEDASVQGNVQQQLQQKALEQLIESSDKANELNSLPEQLDEAR